MRSERCYELSEGALEEQVRYYMRACWHSVAELREMGMDEEDIEQEVRITLWQASRAYEPGKGKVPFQSWLTYKVNFKLRSLKRRLSRKPF